MTRRDVTTDADIQHERAAAQRHRFVFAQVAVVALLFAVASIGGYAWRQQQLAAGAQEAAAAVPAGTSAPLGDLSSFAAITQAMQDSVKAADWAKANSHANDIEYAWDNAEARLKPMNGDAWTHVDDAIDKVLREIRAVSPNPQTAQVALQDLSDTLAKP